jgi:hypothetical protein
MREAIARAAAETAQHAGSGAARTAGIQLTLPREHAGDASTVCAIAAFAADGDGDGDAPAGPAAAGVAEADGGLVSLDALLALAAERAAAERARSAAHLRAAFVAADPAGDGKLGLDEFGLLARALVPGLAEPAVLRFFADAHARADARRPAAPAAAAGLDAASFAEAAHALGVRLRVPLGAPGGGSVAAVGEMVSVLLEEWAPLAARIQAWPTHADGRRELQALGAQMSAMVAATQQPAARDAIVRSPPSQQLLDDAWSLCRRLGALADKHEPRGGHRAPVS